MVKDRAAMIVVVGLVGGCITVPSVVQIDAADGDSIVATLDPGDVKETAFNVDLPTGVVFDVTFDETMDLPSARENLWIEDQEGQVIGVEIDARLETLTVTPTSTLAAGQNHTLVIGDDVSDINGIEMLFGYRVAFYTAP